MVGGKQLSCRRAAGAFVIGWLGEISVDRGEGPRALQRRLHVSAIRGIVRADDEDRVAHGGRARPAVLRPRAAQGDRDERRPQQRPRSLQEGGEGQRMS